MGDEATVTSAAVEPAKKSAAKKSTKKAAAKKAKKVVKKVAKAAKKESNAGRKSALAGKVITKLVDKNPRREGTAGFNSFKLIKNGMTVEKYQAAGGRLQDLKWDIDHKYVKVK